MTQRQLPALLLVIIASFVGLRLYADSWGDWQVGVGTHPAYVVPTKPYFKGENGQHKAVRQAYAPHLRLSMAYDSASPLGRIYPGVRQGIGVAPIFFPHADLGTPVAVYLFQQVPLAKLSSTATLKVEWCGGVSFGWRARMGCIHYRGDKAPHLLCDEHRRHCCARPLRGHWGEY
ncbi:MAG: hypothetical protein LIO90_07275 [Bacteroidales bacterium]|nr:hypothetical protein [Bacteroidales bacterium]